MTKKEWERQHAKQRALERYGITLNRSEMRDLCALIRAAKATFLGRESLRLTHWAVDWKGTILYAIYDSQRKQVVTLLPPERLSRPPAGLTNTAPEWARPAEPRNPAPAWTKDAFGDDNVAT